MGDLESIKVFLAVAEQRSFVAAARALSMTPPSVTRSVNALEARLGVQLLLRTTRQVSLTSAGAAYALRVAPLVQGLDDATEDLRDGQSQTAGLIRINAPMSMGERVLPDVISQFRTLHPRVSVALTLTDRLIDVVAEQTDLAIRISEPPRDKLTIWRKICRVPRLLVAAPRYLDAQGTPAAPEDLLHHTCIAYDAGAGPEVWDLAAGATRRRITAGRVLSSNNGDLTARLAVNGEGIALLPRFIVAEALATGRLRAVLPGWSPPELWLTLTYPPYDRLPTRLATFSDFFETYVTETRPM
ncbi:LysR family transcriptional regulator [Pseudooceanicola sediminis]|uniref:LysR family transcriptional regulator n=1 Tax=Pseudooceanicola sediminis TaxID=2211117 RepID=A0A399IV05_9RHOB|nr:LysR family transcriptional regulator [Pseudooceanicola sediminis]KAA2314918.1 LysR family transcriptional regulator [Puniceibacterium sp. HSS470]RII36943.1 LysR family transcriptional regulator [Pseudooceanicola sediminis]|tara:strand:+ start:15636 stop:16535 length:900 start_codon:yes stop_codon:yes gene_type:complete